MSDKFILTEMNHVKTAFLLEHGKVNEIRCYEEDSELGNIYVGRVTNILKNINAVFVDIRKGESCYLPFEDCADADSLRVNDMIAVQVVKDRVKTKQPTVTAKLSLSGNYVVIHLDGTVGVSAKIRDEAVRKRLKQCLSDTIGEYLTEYNGNTVSLRSEVVHAKGIGGIVRTQAQDADPEAVRAETGALIERLTRLLKAAEYATLYSCIHRNLPSYLSDLAAFAQKKDMELVTDLQEVCQLCAENGLEQPVLYEDKRIPLPSAYNLNVTLDRALSERAYLKSGAYLVIEPTEAMTVIDVNSGKAVKGSDREEIIYKLNVEAAREIARQLRLRNISGIVVVDFISMKSEEQNKNLLAELREATQRDYVSVQVVDMTSLGLVELTRKKVRRPLCEVMKR